MLSTITVLGLIFAKIDGISKCQQKFLKELFTLLPSIRGRFNFVNFARYSPLNESTFRRNYTKYFDWLSFNYAMIQLGMSSPTDILIAAVDASFISKAGKCTYGLDKFWSGCASRAKKGLEISTIALVNVCTGVAWTLDVTQTPSGLAAKEGKKNEYTRIDFYLEQIWDCLPLLTAVTYIVADGYYAKTKVFDAILQMNKQLITKLRPDANMKYLIGTAKKKRKVHGNTKYNGKVNWKDLDLNKWIDMGLHPDQNHIHIYTQELYHVHFKRRLKVVLLLNTKTQTYVLLASTNLFQSALEVLKYYRLRFQIEFLFRDAKQFTGLNHCQARDEHKLDFHFNMSLSAVNLYQLQMQLNKTSPKSLNSFIRKAYNTRVVSLLFDELNSQAELNEFLDIQHPVVQKVLDLGQVTYKKSKVKTAILA